MTKELISDLNLIFSDEETSLSAGAQMVIGRAIRALDLRAGRGEPVAPHIARLRATTDKLEAFLIEKMGAAAYPGGLLEDLTVTTNCIERRLAATQPAASSTGQPSEQQILNAAEQAGLLPNTVSMWLPALHRYHAILAATRETGS